MEDHDIRAVPDRHWAASDANDFEAEYQICREDAQLPGRVDATATTFTSSIELAGALRRAEAAYCEPGKRIDQRDADWPSWYAEYIVWEQAGEQLPL